MYPYCLGDYLRLTTIQLVKAGLLLHVVIFSLHFILFIYVFLFLHCQKGKTFLKKENIFSLLPWLSQLRDCASYRKPFKNLNSLKPLNLWLLILDSSCMVPGYKVFLMRFKFRRFRTSRRPTNTVFSLFQRVVISALSSWTNLLADSNDAESSWTTDASDISRPETWLLWQQKEISVMWPHSASLLLRCHPVHH